MEEVKCPECGCSEFSFRSIYGPGVPEVRIEFCDACGMRKPTTHTPASEN